MSKMVAVVQLLDGLVLALPDDTPTLDLPSGFDDSGRAPLGAWETLTLSRRPLDEEFLVRTWQGSVERGHASWCRVVREPLEDCP